MNINKKKLSQIIFIKTNKLISKTIIDDSVEIICQYLARELIENKSISVKNFGTLTSIVRFHFFRAKEFYTKYIDFRIHNNFLNLLKNKN